MFHVPETARVRIPGMPPARGNEGAFLIGNLRCIASDGEGWEHVSVSLVDRQPTWEEMCYIKNLFWDEEDWVMQFHPAKSEYVNKHPHCLHLWRPVNQDFPKPKRELVG